ncbi:MAG TPA: Hpt domain-containing protein [Actinomycetota bacterium]|nr:Hpt domain-containing protein [Actinomycetota bacterium]
MPGMPQAGDPPLNAATLAELRAGFGDAADAVMASLVELFLADAEAALAEMAGATGATGGTGGDMFARSAHRLKGGAATLGAEPLVALCKEAELYGRAGDLSGRAPLIEGIRAEVARIRAALMGS